MGFFALKTMWRNGGGKGSSYPPPPSGRAKINVWYVRVEKKKFVRPRLECIIFFIIYYSIACIPSGRVEISGLSL